MWQGGVSITGLPERPPQRVRGVDRGAVGQGRAGQGDGAHGVGASVTGVVSLETRQLEVDGDAVGPVESFDRAYELVLVDGVIMLTTSSVDVAREGHPRREWEAGDER